MATAAALAAAGAMAGCGSAGSHADPAPAGVRAGVQPDLPGFVHSSDVRADDKATVTWLDQQLAVLGNARGWLNHAGTSVIDKCSTAFDPGTPYYFIYCTRSVSGYYELSGHIGQRVSQLRRLLENAGWAGFRSLPLPGTAGKDLPAQAAVHFSGATPGFDSEEALFEWGSHLRLRGGPDELARLQPARPVTPDPGVIDFSLANVASVRRVFAASAYLAVVRVSATYFLARGRGAFPSPPS